jgi:hypothetical protein
MPVQKLTVTILPLDLPCSGIVTYSGEILTTEKSQKKAFKGDIQLAVTLKYITELWNK